MIGRLHKLNPVYVLALGALLATSGCGDDETESAGTGGSQQTTSTQGGAGGAGQGGAGQGGSASASIDAKAPTRESITITFNSPPQAIDVAITRDGTSETLTVTGSAWDPATLTFTLNTEKQKLGVDYTVTLSGTDKFDGLSKSFPSADTAKFWATNLDTFQDYEVVARRERVGEKGVLYVQEGFFPIDSKLALDHFDQEVVPKEAPLFGSPPDQDGNGKVLLLGLDGANQYGGYFSPLDSFPQSDLPAGYHSNEMEMLYVNVVSGTWIYDFVVAHEFAHLLYNRPVHWQESWEWHNEGMAECAAHVVHDGDIMDPGYYVQNPNQTFQKGLALTDWSYSNFDQYVQSYLVLTYIASQLGGETAYQDLVNLTGSPDALDGFLQTNLGYDLDEAHRRMLIASQLQNGTGDYSFNGMVTFPAVPGVSGTQSATLPPLAGAFFNSNAATVNAPAAAGADVVFVGITAAGAVDVDAPYTVGQNGLVLAYNRSRTEDTTQPSGSVPSMLPAAPTPNTAAQSALSLRMLRLHPPPVDRRHPEALLRWRRTVGLPELSKATLQTLGRAKTH